MSAGIFRPVVPNQAVATLLLIENSQGMSCVWSDLRDRYLRPLVDTLQGANPGVPITMLVLPSFPPNDDQNLHSVPRQYDGLHEGLRDFRFNFDPNNKLSVGKIGSGIDFLASTKFQGQAAARHIIIVAASTPSEEINGLDLGNRPHDTRSLWQILAQKLAQADIHCHMVLSPTQNMTPLTTLFDETLRLQKNVEVVPWFPMDPGKYLFRLSARPRHQVSSDAAPYIPPPPRRNTPPLQRNYSFPPDTFTMNTTNESAPSEPQSESSPSLVTQLQQVHGLTKKKVYGAKPTRQPFFREERVREKYRRAPTPLMMPMSAPPASQFTPVASRGGRATSRSRTDRIMRIGQGSPTDSPRRQGGWPRRGSRLSSPEGDSLPSPASVSSFSEMSPVTGYFSSNVSSPISPTTTIDDTYHTPNVQPTDASLLIPLESSVVPEPTWLQHSFTPVVPLSQPNLPMFLPDTPLPIVPGSQGTMTTPESALYQTTPIQTPLPSGYAPLPPLQAPSQSIDVSMHTRKGSAGTSRGELPTASTLSQLPALSQDEGDRPFIFNKEYEAATAALFNEEVLPSYPNFPAVSSRRGPFATLEPTAHGSVAFLPPRDSAPLSASMSFSRVDQSYGANVRYPLSHEYLQQPPRQPISRDTSMALSYSSFSPGSSSSLTGWAG